MVPATDEVNPVDHDELQRRLDRFVQSHYGPDAKVQGLEGFSGSHGGLTYGFSCWMQGASVEALVIRMAPQGVRRSGNTDVYRQAPLLRELKRHGYPVPGVRFAGEDDEWFDTAYVIFERLPGRAFIVWDPDPAFDLRPNAVAPLWRRAIETLASVHAFDWQTHLPGWEAPTAIEGEVARWDTVLEKAAEPEWGAMGERVRALLLEQGPPASPVGLLHGDCQPGNILFSERGEVVGLLDWELSAIGAQDLDLGWSLMIGDRESFHPSWCPVNPLSPEELIERYEEAAERRCVGIDWYRALAGYRMGVVTGLFTRLHREGRRPDPAWERFALGVPFLFGRAESLLRAR